MGKKYQQRPIAEMIQKKPASGAHVVVEEAKAKIDKPKTVKKKLSMFKRKGK